MGGDIDVADGFGWWCLRRVMSTKAKTEVGLSGSVGGLRSEPRGERSSLPVMLDAV